MAADGQAIQPSAADVNTIKGWMTLEQVATTFKVPLAELLAQFDLPAETPATTAIKDLETDSFSVTNLRTWLQSRQDGALSSPVTNEFSPIVPTATPEPVATQPVAVEPLTPTATVHTAPDKTITGKTTFQELLDWGVSKEAIQKVIDGNLPPGSTVIKDYITGKGLEFSLVKTTLQAEVDQVK